MIEGTCRVLDARPPVEQLPGLAEAVDALHEALTASCGVSGRATVDMREIALRLRLRDLTWRIALLGLRVAGRVRVEHSPERFETATITLPKHLPLTLYQILAGPDAPDHDFCDHGICRKCGADAEEWEVICDRNAPGPRHDRPGCIDCAVLGEKE